MIYTPDKVNLHTHSFYCRHGKGTIAEYVQQAKADGLTLLGFSEHCPLPDREYQKGNRMDYDELDLYEADIRSEQLRNPDIKILIGAECDWLPDEFSFYKDTYPLWPFWPLIIACALQVLSFRVPSQPLPGALLRTHAVGLYIVECRKCFY